MHMARDFGNLDNMTKQVAILEITFVVNNLKKKPRCSCSEILLPN
jgi:hypothetical protein